MCVVESAIQMTWPLAQPDQKLVCLFQKTFKCTKSPETRVSYQSHLMMLTLTRAAAALKLILATDSRLRLRGMRFRPERELLKEHRDAAPGVMGVEAHCSHLPPPPCETHVLVPMGPQIWTREASLKEKQVHTNYSSGNFWYCTFCMPCWDEGTYRGGGVFCAGQGDVVPGWAAPSHGSPEVSACRSACCSGACSSSAISASRRCPYWPRTSPPCPWERSHNPCSAWCLPIHRSHATPDSLVFLCSCAL